ncbi:MAG: flagellar filament capping protein FliD [Alphaproteobacteria bacterium]|nr:flagellar filament capping protein FliD [Alphaproteobacteria bacterium]
MTTDYINMLNAGSGLNTKEIIDSLVEAERVPVETLITKKTDEIEVSISSFGTLKQNFSDLETNMSGLDGITGMSISQSGTSVDAQVTDNTLFSEFSSDFEVSQIATEHTMVFDGFASELASVGSGTITFEFGTWSNGIFSVNSGATGGNVTISSGADTLAEVKASINAAGLGVTASILKQSDSNYALVLKSQEGEESAMRISMGTSKTVSQTTTGVLNTTAEVQSVAGFASSDLSSLNGKTLFLHDGTNSLSVDFSSTPSDLAAVVSAITSTAGYSNMGFTVTAGSNALTLTYNSSDGNVGLSDVSILSTGGPDDSELYYLTNYDTAGANSYNPAKDLTVSQTTQGVSNTTAEVQSVAGFASSDLSSLNGKTLFLHDGTNSLSVDFSSTPSDLAAVVTAITSATGYSDLDFAVGAGSDALTLTYNSSDGNVELAQVSILPPSSLAVTQTTKGVASSTAEVQSVAGFTASDISSLNGKTLFLHDGTNSLSVDFSSTPSNLAAVVTAITSATGYSDLDFTVSAGTNALTLTYNSSDGDVELADVGYLSATETVTAVDANLTIDGVPITRKSNTISDLIDGMTLTLNSTTSSAETVSGSFDSDSAYLAFSLFIDEINRIKTSLDKLTDRGGLTADAGPLAGDPVASSLKNQLSSILNASIPGFDEEEIYLAYFGFETQQDGSFVVNQDTFTDYFEANPAHFSAFFNSRVSTNSALISASMIGDNYTPGVYSFVLDDDGNGSIGDTNLTNSGNIYSSLSGDVSGLFLTTQAGADDTTLYVGRSLLDTLSSFTSQVLSTSGDIAGKVSDLNTSLLDYQDDADALDGRMASLKERYNEQFGAMEAAIANMKSTETTITNMMEAWKGSMKN